MKTRTTVMAATAVALLLVPGSAWAGDGECAGAGASKAVHDVHETVPATDAFEEQIGEAECAVDAVEGDG